jgi:D-glycero-D-manno-heptose 1,7-bisphosphate phosphatase
MKRNESGSYRMINRAIFLDRDGTLIEDKGYICDFREVEIYPFSLSALRKISENGYRIVVITNQSSIARGICTEEQVEQVHRDIQAHFRKKGVLIDAFYFSPFLETGKVARYRKRDSSRKPGPGMVFQAAADLGIDPGLSWLIGDSARDIIAGEKAGCKSVLVLTGNGRTAEKELESKGIKPNLIAKNLLEGVEKIFMSGSDSGS